jgi:hypothetical protein
VSAALQITVEDADSMALLGALDIGPEQQAAIHARIAAQAGELTRNYLVEMAQTRHDTARELGASPTGFWAAAAESVESRSDAAAATVSIQSPGIGRVDHDVTISREDGGMLTIPVAARAYGVRAAELSREVQMFILHSKTTGNTFLAARQAEKTDKPELMYLLVPEVFQKQDRSLLPSDEAYLGAGQAALRDWVNFQLS